MRGKFLCALALTVPLALALPPPETLTEYARRTATRQAYGMYMMGHKVGWMVIDSRLGSYRGRPVAVVREEDGMRMVMMGDTSVSSGVSTTYYALDGRGEVVACQERLVENESVTTIEVERVAQGLRITRVSDGDRTVRTVASVRDNLAESQELERWLETAAPGARFSDWSCDWGARDLESESVLTLVERRPPLVLLELLQQGARGELLVRPDGTAERMSLGAGLELVAEEESLARAPGELREMVDLMMVKIDRDLGEARTVRTLSLEVEGLEDFVLPQSHRQRLVVDGPRTILELGEDAPEDMGRPLKAAERQEFLAATPELQVDDELRALARKIAPAGEARLKAEKIGAWVYARLEKTGAKNASTARDVLHNRAGDCTEHTLLFVALARAAGLPAREVGGLAYAGDGGFAWHAWAEFHDGHHWVTVDPTWNELPVDATHIKLNEDPRELSWVNLIGRLKLRVLDVGY